MGKNQAGPVKVIKPSKKAQVIVFDEKSYGLRSIKNNSGDWKQKKKERAAASAAEGLEDDGDQVTGAALNRNSKDPDDIADMEVSQLWERLKTTVEDVAASELTGRARRDHLLGKTARLAGIGEVPNLAAKHAPFRIRMGIQEAAKRRERKAKELAREMDAVVAARPHSSHQSKKAKRNRR